MKRKFFIAVCIGSTGLLLSCRLPTSPVRVQLAGPGTESFAKLPTWKVAITNVGAQPIEWRAHVDVRGERDTHYSYWGGYVDDPEGALGPGQGAETCVLIPSKKGAIWRASVGYYVSPTGNVSEVVTRWKKTPNVRGRANGSHTNRMSEAAGSPRSP